GCCRPHRLKGQLLAVLAAEPHLVAAGLPKSSLVLHVAEAGCGLGAVGPAKNTLTRGSSGSPPHRLTSLCCGLVPAPVQNADRGLVWREWLDLLQLSGRAASTRSLSNTLSLLTYLAL
ncbi:hypothetical protein FOZ63_032217, partial [Perkinsus olseni]